jgi:acyl-coenzyme A synthetase/AMP-(fatty) acid ligase
MRVDGRGLAMGVAERIFAHARAAPGKTALIADGRVFSYRDLATRVALARTFFAGEGVSRDKVAVIFINELAEAWIAGLALRSLGLTTVNGLALGDLGQWPGGGAIAVSLARNSTADLAAAAQAVEAPLILVPAVSSAELSRADFGEADAAFASPSGAHILRTSGTTGVYKKVLIDPTSEVAGVALRAEMYGLSATSVVALFNFGGWTGVGYQTAVCVWSIGGTVVFHQERAIWRSLQGVTFAYTHPQLLAAILAAPPEIPLRNDAMTLIVGAGALPLADWREARERLTTDIRTGYASTEAGPCCLTRIETPEDIAWHQIHPAFEVQVVDDDDRPLGPAVTGVVRVRTGGVAGYLDDPEATRAFFKDGYFYPGDLGVLREDGRLSIQGRVTDVISVLGDKIATTPIETALQEALGAEAVCVFSAPGPDGEAVHVAIQPRGPIGPDVLKAALQKTLPRVTQVRVHAVEGFPRNALGKIERAVLRSRLLPGEGA